MKKKEIEDFVHNWITYNPDKISYVLKKNNIIFAISSLLPIYNQKNDENFWRIIKLQQTNNKKEFESIDGEDIYKLYH